MYSLGFFADMIQVSIYLISCSLLGLAFLVWRARPSSATNRSFSVYTLFIAIWSFAIASMQSGGHLNLASRLTFAAASLIPATFLAFVYYYPTPSKWPGKAGLCLNFGVASVLVTVSLTTRLIVGDARMTAAGLTRETGPLYPLAHGTGGHPCEMETSTWTSAGAASLPRTRSDDFECRRHHDEPHPPAADGKIDLRLDRTAFCPRSGRHGGACHYSPSPHGRPSRNPP